MIDCHCHILPCLDDGVQNEKDSLQILKHLKDYRINKLVFTPHINTHYNNYNDCINVYNKIKSLNPDCQIQTKLGFELHWTQLADCDSVNLSKYFIENTKIILLEFSYDALPCNWKSIISKLSSMGVKIIVVHPERCKDIQKDVSIIKEMRNLSCGIMLSANFINKKICKGYAYKSAKNMLKLHFVDAICSDAHCLEDYKYLKKAYKFAQKYDFYEEDNDQYLNRVVFYEA